MKKTKQYKTVYLNQKAKAHVAKMKKTNMSCIIF